MSVIHVLGNGCYNMSSSSVCWLSGEWMFHGWWWFVSWSQQQQPIQNRECKPDQLNQLNPCTFNWTVDKVQSKMQIKYYTYIRSFYNLRFLQFASWPIHSDFPIPSTANFPLKGRASKCDCTRLFLLVGNLLLSGWKPCYEWLTCYL